MSRSEKITFTGATGEQLAARLDLPDGDIKAYAGATPCPVVGRISMDLITIDVTDLPEDPERLRILNGHQTVDDLAEAAGTIGYEILTSLGARYSRGYIE